MCKKAEVSSLTGPEKYAGAANSITVLLSAEEAVPLLLLPLLPPPPLCSWFRRTLKLTLRF